MLCNRGISPNPIFIHQRNQISFTEEWGRFCFSVDHFDLRWYKPVGNGGFVSDWQIKKKEIREKMEKKRTFDGVRSREYSCRPTFDRYKSSKSLALSQSIQIDQTFLPPPWVSPLFIWELVSVQSSLSDNPHKPVRWPTASAEQEAKKVRVTSS